MFRRLLSALGANVGSLVSWSDQGWPDWRDAYMACRQRVGDEAYCRDKRTLRDSPWSGAIAG